MEAVRRNAGWIVLGVFVFLLAVGGITHMVNAAAEQRRAVAYNLERKQEQFQQQQVADAKAADDQARADAVQKAKQDKADAAYFKAKQQRDDRDAAQWTVSHTVPQAPTPTMAMHPAETSPNNQVPDQPMLPDSAPAATAPVDTMQPLKEELEQQVQSEYGGCRNIAFRQTPSGFTATVTFNDGDMASYINGGSGWTELFPKMNPAIFAVHA